MDEASELDALRNRLQQADLSVIHEGETRCCYARSDKSWVTDPSGVAWEAFQTLEDVPVYSGGDAEVACCTPDSAERARKACCA